MSHKTLLLLFGNSHEKSLIILVIQIIMYINFYSRNTDPKCIKKKKKKLERGEPQIGKHILNSKSTHKIGNESTIDMSTKWKKIK